MGKYDALHEEDAPSKYALLHDEEGAPLRAPKSIERPTMVAGQPGGLVVPGNIDIGHRPEVQNGDGSYSTVRSMGITDDDGKEVLVPTVHDDGYVMDDDEAVDHYRKSGRHLGKFDSREASDVYGESLHKEQESAQHEPSKRVPFYGPTQDAAGPPEKFDPTRTEAMAAGWLENIPGASHLAGAARSVKDNWGTRESLLNDWRNERENVRKIAEAGKEKYPGMYYSGAAPATAAKLALVGLLTPASGGVVLPHLNRILGTAALSAAENASDGKPSEDLGENVAADVAKTEALNLMLRGAAKPIQNLAKGAQWPDKAAKWATDKLGRTKFGEWLGGETGKDVASRLASATRRGEAELPETGGFVVKAKDFGDDIAGASRGVRADVLKKHLPEIEDLDTNAFDKAKDRVTELLDAAAKARETASKFSNGTQYLKEAERLESVANELSGRIAKASGEASTGRSDAFKKLVGEAKAKPSAADIGKRAAENVGGAVGAGVGAVKHGVVGGVAGAWTGKKAVGAALSGAEKVADIGKRIESIKPLLDRLSQRPGAVGRMAKAVLTSGNREALSRLATLVDLSPDAQPQKP